MQSAEKGVWILPHIKMSKAGALIRKHYKKKLIIIKFAIDNPRS